MKIIAYIFLLTYAVSSCTDRNFYYEEVREVNNDWGAEDLKSFQFPVKEKDKSYTLYFVLRNNNDYKYSNIYFFTKLLSPKNEIIIDTLEYQLARPDGNWIGNGMGSIKQNTLIYKENIQLRDTGNYSISVGQGMRELHLKGIEDISLMVETK